jgi:hypothetical protein
MAFAALLVGFAGAKVIKIFDTTKYLRIFFTLNTRNFSIQKISFLRFTPPPLPLYGCKAHKHWVQTEGEVGMLFNKWRLIFNNQPLLFNTRALLNIDH